MWYSCFITHPNCHHQITYCKLNLKINYPPPFKRLVWDYKKANSVCIKETLRTVNWDALFHLKSVHEQVNVFDVVINIFSNFVLNKIIGIGDREPPWMNDFNKNKIKEKNKAFKQYKNNFSNLQKSSQELSELITKRKEDYNHHLANKLNDPQSLPKTFWKVLKAFYNGNKIPLISPIIVNNKLVSDYEGKANHFNKFFASQFTPIDNDFQIPDSVVFNTEARLSSITCEDSDILKIIRNLDIIKAHGFDDISVRMAKLCDDSLVKTFIKNIPELVFFLIVEKNQTLCQFIRKMTNNK